VLTPEVLRTAYATEVYVGTNALTGGPIVLPRGPTRT